MNELFTFTLTEVSYMKGTHGCMVTNDLMIQLVDFNSKVRDIRSNHWLQPGSIRDWPSSSYSIYRSVYV